MRPWERKIASIMEANRKILGSRAEAPGGVFCDAETGERIRAASAVEAETFRDLVETSGPGALGDRVWGKAFGIGLRYVVWRSSGSGVSNPPNPAEALRRLGWEFVKKKEQRSGDTVFVLFKSSVCKCRGGRFDGWVLRGGGMPEHVVMRRVKRLIKAAGRL